MSIRSFRAVEVRQLVLVIDSGRADKSGSARADRHYRMQGHRGAGQILVAYLDQLLQSLPLFPCEMMVDCCVVLSIMYAALS